MLKIIIHVAEQAGSAKAASLSPQMESSQEVRLFLLPFGPAPSTLPSPGDIVSLHAAYERSMPHNFGGVTTVVCRCAKIGSR